MKATSGGRIVRASVGRFGGAPVATSEIGAAIASVSTLSDKIDRVTAEKLRSACLAQAGAVEEFPFGPQTAVFKVAGKIFALSGLASPLRVSLKCEPELAEQLRAAHPEIVPGYHLNKRHWNTVSVDGLDSRMVLDMIEDSYDLVVAALPRRERERLDWRPAD